MTAHRLLSSDGGPESVNCYACGIEAEAADAAQAFDCRPGGWTHPPYVLADGSVETCAAHPYSDCVIDAPRIGVESIG